MKGKMFVPELLNFLENFNFWTNCGQIYPAFYQWLQMAADADGWVDTDEVKAGMDAWDFRQVQHHVTTCIPDLISK